MKEIKQHVKQAKKSVKRFVRKYIQVPNRVNNLVNKYYDFSSQCYDHVMNLDNVIRNLI